MVASWSGAASRGAFGPALPARPHDRAIPAQSVMAAWFGKQAQNHPKEPDQHVADSVFRQHRRLDTRPRSKRLCLLRSRRGTCSIECAQELLAYQVATTTYRPCCDNPTFFQDCNHGSALFGLIALMASQGGSEDELYRAALAANSYWFPDKYVLTALQFMRTGHPRWRSVDPTLVLGRDFSSLSGWQQNVSAPLELWPCQIAARPGRPACLWDLGDGQHFGLKFMNDKTEGFEQIRMVASALEELNRSVPQARQWLKAIIAPATRTALMAAAPAKPARRPFTS